MGGAPLAKASIENSNATMLAFTMLCWVSRIVPKRSPEIGEETKIIPAKDFRPNFMGNSVTTPCSYVLLATTQQVCCW